MNPYTFPLVPYPGLAPEQAVRAASGDWEAHAQPIPTDRLLPFVLTRALLPANTPWLNCARIEHADTGALLYELRPTGPGTALTPLDLPLRKYRDVAAGLEHFVYVGGQLPGLTLPCGTPVRLVLDDAWQGPRCLPIVGGAGQPVSAFLLLEWWNDGPTAGVPYGAGFRQRLYIENGGLLHGEPIRQRDVTKSLADETERVDAVTLIRTASVSVPPVPAYLTQALAAAEAVGRFEADGEPWQLTEAKQSSAGADGGRWTLTLNLKQRTATRYRASCPAPALAEAPYDPTRDTRHPWRCGDLTDTAPEWQTTARTCALDTNGDNTGFVTLSQRDVNPQSPTFNTTRTAPYQEGPDALACPVPPIFRSIKVEGLTAKNDCPPNFESSRLVYFFITEGARTSRVSQEAANALAQADYNIQAQANANANGACQAGGQWEPVYEDNNCFSCRMQNINDPSQQRAATPEEAADYYRRYGNDPGGTNRVVCPRCF